MTSQDNPVVQEIIELEMQWANAIQRQDAAQMDNLLANNFVFAVAVQGLPLQLLNREQLLAALPTYQVETWAIDDIQVHIYGDSAIAIMLYTQKALVRGQDRSAQFALTDVWVRQSSGWRVAERHSSRPEPQAATRPS